MAVLDRAKEFLLPDQQKIPPDVKACLKRGREEMLRDASKRRMCLRFERGETYWYLTSKAKLVEQNTATLFSPKPHRIRNKYNYIRPIVDGKVSAATQMTPGYEVLPTSTDPDRVAAAKLAEAVATYGYDKWRLRHIRMRAIKLAIAGGGEGFVMPYFDPNVGPYHQVGDQFVGEGEVKLRVLNGNEVYWEPGVEFEDSRWWATEQAVPKDVVEEYEGFYGGDLSADASGSDVPSDPKNTSNLVTVTEFYERPCPSYPRGRKIRLANGRIITPLEDYPLQDRQGNVLDEPVIHRLVYTLDSDGKRDLGLVWQLIDYQRTSQDCWNKALEWKNRCLMPQILAPMGSIDPQFTMSDEPGKIVFYRPTGGQPPKWEDTPRIPPELFSMLDRAKADMQAVAADEQIEAGPNVAAQTVQQVVEQARARWASFLGDVAEWDSRIMRHCLFLVSRFYTEPRLLQVRGRYAAAQPLTDFLGENLLDEVDVRVSPTSIQVRNRQELTQQVMNFAQNQWITPEQAMAAINDGTGAAKFVESYELDIGKVNRIIAKVKDGSVMQMPTRQQNDPVTGQPMGDPQTGQPAEIPGWMPDEQDNLSVWRTVLSDWMKTDEFDQLDPAMQEVARQILSGVERLDAAKAQRAAIAQAQQAGELGMANAAKPSQAKPMPSFPSMSGAPNGAGQQPGPQ